MRAAYVFTRREAGPWRGPSPARANPGLLVLLAVLALATGCGQLPGLDEATAPASDADAVADTEAEADDTPTGGDGAGAGGESSEQLPDDEAEAAVSVGPVRDPRPETSEDETADAETADDAAADEAAADQTTTDASTSGVTDENVRSSVQRIADHPGCEVEDPSVSENEHALYEVHGDELILVFGRPSDWHQTHWNRVVEIIPEPARTEISCYVAEKDLGGYVVQEPDPFYWRLALGRFNRPHERDDLDFIIVHEIAHIWSLNTEQVDPWPFSSCETFEIYEGCVLPDSAYRQFVDLFWPAEQQDLLFDDGGPVDPARALYQDRPDHFVSEYAATNPAEDFAETFAVWVFDPPTDGTTIADDKLRFMGQFPELVAIRGYVLANR